MSTFTYPAFVANPRGGTPPIEVKFLVDTGTMFTCLPASQLETLGLAPQWRGLILLAAGRREEGAATEILLPITGRALHTTCLFGPPGSLALLGAVGAEQR